MWDYTEKVKEAFLRPRNAGALPDADAIGEVGSIICGDALKLFLKIDRETDTILDARFQTFGCASAIASSSALTELIRGKTLDQALAVTNQDIADYLGGLPMQKMHCSVMGREALGAAISNYRGTPAGNVPAGRIVCQCFQVSEEKIRHAALDNHLTTVEEITNFTKAGGGCGSCRDDISRILSALREREETPEARQTGRLTNLKKIALIQEVIAGVIRPRLQAAGSDVELIDIEGSRVIVEFRGACGTGAEPARAELEQKLRALVSSDIVVENG